MTKYVVSTAFAGRSLQSFHQLKHGGLASSARFRLTWSPGD